jgi:mono/diheme cytochrome c family protein
MRLSRIIKGIFLVLILLIGAGFALSWRPSIAPVFADEGLRADKQTVAHGAALAAIGNCNDCHATDGGESFAGGRPIPTPFGTIFATNITPDADTGIGRWSEAAFRRAMRTGVDREGRQLHPAFPYDHFTRATDDDIHALYAFLRSQSAVSLLKNVIWRGFGRQMIAVIHGPVSASGAPAALDIWILPG